LPRRKAFARHIVRLSISLIIVSFWALTPRFAVTARQASVQNQVTLILEHSRSTGYQPYRSRYDDFGRLELVINYVFGAYKCRKYACEGLRFAYADFLGSIWARWVRREGTPIFVICFIAWQWKIGALRDHQGDRVRQDAGQRSAGSNIFVISSEELRFAERSAHTP
jgi:hypothetical protein